MLTLTISLMVITGLTGFMDFMFKTLLVTTLEPAGERKAFFAARFDPSTGWSAILAQGLDSFLVSDEELAALAEVTEGRATFGTVHFVVSPELSFIGDGYFSYIMDPDIVHQLGDTMFTFTEGDWETALPIMRSGCGVLVMPLVAVKNNAGLGDTFTATHAGGTVECTVAGIGMTATSASIISMAAGDDFDISNPVMTIITPYLDTDADALEAAMREIPGLAINSFSVFSDALTESIGLMTTAMNGMLLLAVLAAALGVVNTTVMSISERRRELGLLRAVGATKRQTRMVVVGEAALMGFTGGAVGLIGGIGFVVIFVVIPIIRQDELYSWGVG